MASFVFENGTQAQASSFQAGDTLVFGTATPRDLGVTYTPASGFNVATVTLTQGAQSLTFSAAALSDPSTDLSFLTAGDGTLLLGTTGADTASVATTGDSAGYGFDGADTLTIGGSGNHFVDGGSGGDTINAGAATGNLYLFGGTGGDTVTGGSGNDHLYGNAISSTQGASDGTDSLVGGAGSDYLQGNAGADTLDGGTGSDRIFGGGDADSIIGGAGNDSVNGNLGDDTIAGGADNDSLRGGQGDDEITGDAGNDVVQGDLGDDTVTGGAGTDLVSGGDGADVFSFGATDAQAAANATQFDTITDFASGTDTIELGFTGVDVEYATGATFTTVSAARTFADTLLAGTTDTVASIAVGSDTYLFFNGTGGATIDSVIKLTGIATASTIDADSFA